MILAIKGFMMLRIEGIGTTITAVAIPCGLDGDDLPRRPKHHPPRQKQRPLT